VALTPPIKCKHPPIKQIKKNIEEMTKSFLGISSLI
jgi:hypothetical protein